ncbi:MAG: hypothetical protein AB1611_17055 [bacterium]
MAHIFFERLENRQSTQSLYAGYGIPATTPRLYYGIQTTDTATYYGVGVQTTSQYNPLLYPSFGSYPWGGWSSWGYGYGYNPYGFGSYSLFNPIALWNNPFTPYASPWANPFSNLWGGISNLFSPLWNIFGGLFGWQSSPWSGYPVSPGSYTPDPGGAVAIYAAPISGPIALYAIDLPSTSTSYSPPGSTVWALYGISQPVSSWPY